MSEFTIAGQTYRYAKRMPAMTQLHVIRKFGPAMKRAQARGSEEIVEVFGEMSDADAEYVAKACLACLTRKQGETWVSVWNEVANAPQYDDIQANALFELASVVMLTVFQGFSQGPLSA